MQRMVRRANPWDLEEFFANMRLRGADSASDISRPTMPLDDAGFA